MLIIIIVILIFNVNNESNNKQPVIVESNINDNIKINHQVKDDNDKSLNRNILANTLVNHTYTDLCDNHNTCYIGLSKAQLSSSLNNELFINFVKIEDNTIIINITNNTTEAFKASTLKAFELRFVEDNKFYALPYNEEIMIYTETVSIQGRSFSLIHLNDDESVWPKDNINLVFTLKRDDDRRPCDEFALYFNTHSGNTAYTLFSEVVNCKQ